MFQRRASLRKQRERLVDDFVFELAQLWVVARCQCTMARGWHSLSHLDCFSVEPWLVEELRRCAHRLLELDSPPKHSELVKWRQQVQSRLSRCSESADSLNQCVEPDSLCNTARNGH